MVTARLSAAPSDKEFASHPYMQANRLLDKVTSVGEQGIRLIAGLFVAAAAAFASSYGIIVTLAVLGLNLVVTPLISLQARASVADPNFLFSLEARIELFVKARLWENAIFNSMFLGAGAGAIYHGFNVIGLSSYFSAFIGGGALGLLLSRFGKHVDLADVADSIKIFGALQEGQRRVKPS